MINKQRITQPLARKVRGNMADLWRKAARKAGKTPVESQQESLCGHRRQIALHGPTGLTMRCERCGAVLTRPDKLSGSVGRVRPSGAQRRLK